MVIDKVSRKLRIAYNLLRDEGALAVCIRSLEFVQKKTSRHHKPSKGNTLNSINTGGLYHEIIKTDTSIKANKNYKPPQKKKSHLTFNWLMPPPGAGSGGHMNIFRYIKYLEDSGHKCNIYLFNPGEYSTVEAVKAVMGNGFPRVKAEMKWLHKDQQMDQADGVFATSWQTAYTVYNTEQNTKKFYFVQDFEPYFYPVGGLYTLAENTYKLGLHGITAGGWLSSKLSKEYDMTTNKLDFGCDTDIYNFKRQNNRKRVVFYARPTTERRAFELGILSLDIFHSKHPDYEINFVGWDISNFDIPFPYKNNGVLSQGELNNLYNSCSAGLVLSMTNMSLLPLELLGSGCIPVVNKGENNSLVSNNKYIAYSEPTPIDIADKLSSIVTKNNLQDYSDKASKSVTNNSWDKSGKRFVSILEKSVYENGDK